MSERAFFFPRNIYLIGFMGAGKSAAAFYLKSSCHAQILDMDEEISLREQKTINDIFSIYGEERFRELESSALKKAANMCGLVVSCGGGAVLKPENVALMKKTGLIVYLKVSPKTVCERLKGSGGRPLLDGRLTEACVKRLMEKRREIYEKSADIYVDTDGMSTQKVCDEIIAKVKRRLTGDV